MDACWTFTATGHGKGAGDGIGAVLKSTARRVTLAKNILLSSPKDFYEFSREQQLQTAQANGKEDPAVHIFFLHAREMEQAKGTTLNQRAEQIKSSGNSSFLSVLNTDDFHVGALHGIRAMHEFQPINNGTINYRKTSRSSQVYRFIFQ